MILPICVRSSNAVSTPSAPTGLISSGRLTSELRRQRELQPFFLPRALASVTVRHALEERPQVRAAVDADIVFPRPGEHHEKISIRPSHAVAHEELLVLELLVHIFEPREALLFLGGRP